MFKEKEIEKNKTKYSTEKRIRERDLEVKKGIFGNDETVGWTL